MRKRIFSGMLALVMLLGLMFFTQIPVLAATSDTDMDALSAIGINTDEAPDGFNQLSTDNPYGTNTIQISPVYELYTLGLKNQVSYNSSYSTTSVLQNGSNTAIHSTVSDNNILQSMLYGNAAWSATSVQAIMGSHTTSNIKSGTTTADGIYNLISSGTITDINANNISANGYLTGASNAYTNLGNGFKYALSSVAAGNFDGNTSALSAQTVMVYTSDYSCNGGLYLRFGNAITGTYGDNAKTLLTSENDIGNPDLTYSNKPVENFAPNPYQLQNYLQVATGDWNGDGLDEVAVYVPEAGNSRIMVYALQLTDADNKNTAYLDASKWSVVWTYYLHEGDVVSNMVSLVNGDVNQDGTDDLAATWGYYYGPTQNTGSTAVVMFGAKGTAMLGTSQQFDLKYGSSNIVRASFAFGDMAGSDEDVLILCGQSDADLKQGNTLSRYVALYSWDGDSFTSNVYQNFDLFAKDDDGKYVWDAMKYDYHSDKFYSLPLCVANAAVISQGVSGGGDLLYFDSLIIEYTDSGLNIKESWDNTEAMQQNKNSCVEYVEYSAVAGDLTGQTGSGALITMTQTLCSTEQNSTTYTINGSHSEPIWVRDYYYQNWLYKLFNIRSYYYYISGYQTVIDPTPVNANYEQLTMGKAYMVTVDPFTNSGSSGSYYNSRSETDFSSSLCLANTDNDSSYMNYTGTHYYTYTDPQVLAVLASPPYFSDLLGRDDLSGNYAESSTSYSSTSGGGIGANVSATITLGAYVSYEQDIEVFGVKVASVEAEAQVTAGFTWEMEQTCTLEQTITYSAAAGEDMIALYSIPMEIYQYETYVPNGSGSYKKVLTTVNIPHEASKRLMSLNEYESIAKDYSVLPSVADNVLTHDVGDPYTYPSGTDGYNVIAKYTNGAPAAVGFSSAAGGSGITQEIAMSTETSNAFTVTAAVEAKAGAGAGGFKVGVIAGAEVGAGLVLISTDGSSFSGEMQNMPIEAQPYGYGMNWRIFCYKYTNGGNSFPVVSYIVSDVKKPPMLPNDFEQDVSTTDDHSITLTWSYDKNVSGFQIYRYYDFPDGTGSYALDFVPFTAATDYDSDTGTYYFSYTDDGLSPYTEYTYQIQTVRATTPKKSIYSEPMSCRTKTEVGYPTINISGLVNGQLPIYPDADSTVTLSVDNPDSYNGLSYQWQKLIDGSWTNISGKTDVEFTISNAGIADNITYRCRVNAIYYDESTATNYYISAYSDAISTVYSKRTPTGTLTAAENVIPASGGTVLDGLTASIELHSANTNHSAAPTGNVTFTITGTDYNYSETAALTTSNSTDSFDGSYKFYSTASMSLASLPDGVYTVTAYYSGSRVFKDKEFSSGVLVVVGEGSAYRLTLSTYSNGDNPVSGFDYSNKIYPSLVSISKDINDKVTSTPVENATYRLVSSGSDDSTAFAAGSTTPYVGSYTLQAVVNGDVVATQDFTVNKKNITITVEDKENVGTDEVEENPPVIVSSDLSDAALAALKLTYTATNSAGGSATLENTTLPGNYTVTACSGSETPVDLYNNYNITYVSGTYTIIGATYTLTAVAADYADQSGSRTVGKVGISNVSQTHANYASKTNVLLYATPEAGYQVDTWTAEFYDGTTKTQVGGSTYTFETQAQTVTVTVTFKPAEIRLHTVAQPTAGGSITCSDEYFTSGAYVSYGAEYSFTAFPEDGYHFSKWQTLAGFITTTYNGVTNADGSNTLIIDVGTASMTVFARFERDFYSLTLNGNIEAYYMYDDDGDLSTDPIKMRINSGSAVPGDTEITVTPKVGYQAADGAYITVNDIVSADDKSHVFPIIKNTVVSLDTVRNSYAVTTAAENGSIAVAVDGASASGDELTAVEGGSSVTFTAHADRGYVFDHWLKNGDDVANSTKTLTIKELGSATDITAVFTQNTERNVTAVVSDAARGTMHYTLYDIYGDLVGEANTLMPDSGLTIYDGESIILTVSVSSGSMMEQWKVNGTNTYSTQKTYTIDDIDGDVDAVAYLKAASKYCVYFLVMGDSGSTLEATADNMGFVSGKLQSGGSTLIFSAKPTDGFMVDYWTVTEGNLTADENGTLTDAEGNVIVDPTYTIDPLKQNITVRAHFTDLATNTVTLPDASDMGISAITHVTPLLPDDDGIRDLISESVRNGGTVKMTFTPSDGYATDTERLEEVLQEVVNDGATVTVEENDGVFSATIINLQQSFSLTDTDIYYNVYTITVPDGVTVSSETAAEGDTVTLTVKPNSGYKLSTLILDNGTLNEEVSSSTLTYTFTMPATDVTVSASFVLSGNGAGGGEGGGGGSEQITIPVSGNQNSIQVSVTVNNGIAELDLDSDALAELISGGTGNGIISFDLSSLNDVTAAVIPSDAFNVLQDSASSIDGLQISLPAGDVTFDAAAIAAIGNAGNGDVTLEASMVDITKLTDEQQALIDGRPVIDLTLTVGNKVVSDFGSGSVEVSVPYTLNSGENPDSVVVWYLNDKGVLELVTGQYNAATKSVVFETDHFSKYVIGSLPFTDVSRDMWYFDSVSFVYANNLFCGTSESNFTPEATMTRAMLVTVLWRIEGEPAASANLFTDVANGAWYTEAVAWAAANGIVSGYGNGQFGTNDLVTREQTATILMNYAKYKGYDVSATTDLSSFTDVQNISTWAKTAIQWANAEGLINGTGNNTLDPKGNSQRCQVAAILQRFIDNIAE